MIILEQNYPGKHVWCSVWNRRCECHSCWWGIEEIQIQWMTFGMWLICCLIPSCHLFSNTLCQCCEPEMLWGSTFSFCSTVCILGFNLVRGDMTGTHTTTSGCAGSLFENASKRTTEQEKIKAKKRGSRVSAWESDTKRSSGVYSQLCCQWYICIFYN